MGPEVESGCNVKPRPKAGFMLNSTFFYFFPLYHQVGLRQHVRMMQECPKCGFAQPADRYCPNCGLDIENFKPKPTSIIKKLGQNTALHVTAVLIVVSVVVAVIYNLQKNKLLEHLRNAKLAVTAPIAATTAQDLEAAKKTAVTGSTAENGAAVATTTPAASAQGAATSAMAAATGTTAAGDTGAHATAKAAARQKIQVTFAEVSQTVLQQLASEGQILNDNGQRRAFMVNNLDSIEKLKERDPDFKVLPGGTIRNFKVNNPVAFDFAHISSTNEDVGMSFEITPTSNNDSGVEITMNGMLHLKGDSNTSITNHEIAATFSFTPHSTLVLVGYLPHQAIRDEDQEFFANTPLVIYESLGFLNNVTEFAIFINTK